MNRENLLTVLAAMRKDITSTTPCDFSVLHAIDICTDALNGDAILTNVDLIVMLVENLDINELDGLREVLATRSLRMKDKEAKKFAALKNVA